MTVTSTASGSSRMGGTAPLAVDLAGVRKNFGHVQAVDGVDLQISSGEIVAFLGPNGAGKTSTIDIVLGLSKPSAGDVEVFGMSPRSAITHGLVSAVMQTGGLLRDLTVGETVEYTASLFAHSQSPAEVLRRAGIAELADRRVGKCSGGEQQRLRFAMALMSDPELLVLDEPTTGMDVEGRRSFWAAIRKDAALGRTVLFATHYLEEADAYADRIVLMRHGKIVADGTASEIKAMAAGRTVRATLPGATEDSLRTIPGAETVEIRGETVLIHSKDSDATARYLLTSTAAKDLEVTARGIEDAFIALTGDDAGLRRRDYWSIVMSTLPSPVMPDLSTRRAPGLGGFNLTALKLEVRRLVRNRRTVIISIVVPVVFFLLFGLNKSYDSQPDGHGNVAAFVMISLALYGAVLATTFGGAMVSIERAQGWSRQLRLTPLSPVAYIVIKILTALVLGACSVGSVYIAGIVSHKPSMSVGLWLATGFSVWIGSLLFAAFGLFLGYLLPAENVLQLLGLILALLSFAGGLFIPISQFAQGVQDVAKFTPLYGLNQLVHAPLLGTGVPWTWPVNVLAWLIIFAGGAIWRMRTDTGRM